MTHKNGSLPGHPSIFVFGSNLAGRHGAGAAKVAVQKFGAVYGISRGLMGNSYAIPTKDHNLRVRLLDDIRKDVEIFIRYAEENPETSFFVTEIGCGLAGMSDLDMAPLFCNAPSNCDLTEDWVRIIEMHRSELRR